MIVRIRLMPCVFYCKETHDDKQITVTEKQHLPLQKLNSEIFMLSRSQVYYSEAFGGRVYQSVSPTLWVCFDDSQLLELITWRASLQYRLLGIVLFSSVEQGLPHLMTRLSKAPYIATRTGDRYWETRGETARMKMQENANLFQNKWQVRKIFPWCTRNPFWINEIQETV